MSERFGSYEIHEKLGAGGLASVHLAKTRAVANPVALKRLFPHIAEIRELVDSFIDEARLAKYLRHPGIARVYEFGKLRGTYFIAFEFVPGPTLLQLADRCAEYVGPMPVMVVLEILYQLCDALDHAHQLTNELGLPLGIVHRDVSPQNVIVSTTGQVKLIDFGLAKTKQSTVHSQAGIIKGKLNYVAPEYLMGKLDSRCDIWALGVVMYELLTGKRLFDAPEQQEILRRVQVMPVPSPSASNPDVSADVDAIVHKALNRDPEQRWQRAGEMRDEIGRVAAGRLTQKQFVSWVEWVFAQKEPLRREDSAVSALQEIMSHEIDVVGDLHALAEAMLDRRRESVAQMPVSEEVRRPPRLKLWIGVLVTLAATVAVLLVALLSGCGRIDFGGVASDAGGSDVADAAIDAELPCAQFGAWGPVQRIGELASVNEDYGAEISSDGLSLYWESNRGGADRLYESTRATRSSTWGAGRELTELGLSIADPTVTGDGLEIFYTKPTAPEDCIYRASRANKADAFSAGAPVPGLCTVAAYHNCPHVTADGLTIVYSTTNGQTFLATRSDRNADFPEGSGFPNLFTGLSCPYITDDLLTLYYEEGSPSVIEFAKRSVPSGGFDVQKQPVTETDSVGNDNEDISLTSDGLEMHFDSNRPGGTGAHDLYFLQRECLSR